MASWRSVPARGARAVAASFACAELASASVPKALPIRFAGAAARCLGRTLQGGCGIILLHSNIDLVVTSHSRVFFSAVIDLQLRCHARRNTKS
jgi:hypothetical protein